MWSDWESSGKPVTIEDERRAAEPLPRQSHGRRAIVGLLLLSLVSLLWWRSREHADVMAVFGPSGKIGGVISFRGQVLIAFTNIDMGAARAWTIQTLSASAEDGDDLRNMLTGDVPAPVSSSLPVISQKYGFLVARHERDAFGLSGKWCSVIGVPHWVLLPLGAWPMLAWSVRRARLQRRKSRGWCPICGYDLHGAVERCPECGTRIAA